MPSIVALPSTGIARSRLVLGGLFLLAGCCGWFASLAEAEPKPQQLATKPSEYSFHYDHILGTSLDVWLVAENEKEAWKAEQALLNEIERLRLVFSTYDSQSELSRLNRTNEPVAISQELFEVLQAYETWQQRSG